MARISKFLRKSGSRRIKVTSNALCSPHQKISADNNGPVEQKLWEDARCSVCMECPHNAVLLLCSSYHKGCRPYMCATSHHFSNCLDQYKKTYTKVTAVQNVRLGSLSASKPSAGLPGEKMEVAELPCPLCRGNVKGWTVVESARDYLNSKKRTCMHDKCCFVGNYRRLRKHVKTHHPSAKPLQVDPALEAKWKRLESERERNDVISTITSTTPGAIVLGDYVIERNYHDIYNGGDSDVSSFDSDDSEILVFHRRAFWGRHTSDGQQNGLMFPRHRRFFNERSSMHPMRRAGGRSRGSRVGHL
uniref:Uncharacterized protein n=1 Tax=Kalanchoe fedtschenkoi TaxID=63787 RepID=A0A7N1A7Z8_KALFE